MLVLPGEIDHIIARLETKKVLALDTETTGLRPWHGDRLFSIVISDGEIEYYFDFNHETDHEGNTSGTLSRECMSKILPLFLKNKIEWVLHNAKYDLAILHQEGVNIAGSIYCCRAQGRVAQNDLFQYNLNALLKPLGLSKDDAVKAYIEEHKLSEKRDIPGKQTKESVLHFERVPLRIMQPYAEMDARGTFKLREWQISEKMRKCKGYPENAPNLFSVTETEQKLTKVVFKMEATGVKIDRGYCERARDFEKERFSLLGKQFEAITGRTYSASGKLFAEVFADEKEKWEYTEKGNPSFSGDVLEFFTSKAAKTVVQMREAKSKSDFYNGFLYHADSDDIIHPNFNPDGTGTGRFSSSDPNLQNLTSEEDEEQIAQEFIVRRAIIPRPGFIFIMPDYDQMEYKQMLDLAKEMAIQNLLIRGIKSWGPKYFEVADKVAQGFDVHQATADLAGITRKQAKTLNFALLYGAGVAKLALMLGVSIQEAAHLKQRYFAALPYIESMIAEISYTAKFRGWVRNFAGRRYDCADPNFSYKMTNYVVQGGCADAVKLSMCEIDSFLEDKKSRMVLTIHDEIPCEIHESEIKYVPHEIKRIMESVYPFKHIPLTAGMEWSNKSLGDKVKGFPI